MSRNSLGTHVLPGEEIEVTANRTAERPNNGECDRSAHQELSLPSETTEFSLKDTFSGRDPDRGMAATDVPFRWGTLGWGYLHVANEHGWDNDRDRSDTQAALFDPAPEPDAPARIGSTSSISGRTGSPALAELWHGSMHLTASPRNAESSRHSRTLVGTGRAIFHRDEDELPRHRHR